MVDQPDSKSIAIILVNLGTPDAPTASAVSRYLREFLSDRRVVEIPRWIWWPLLNGVIAPLRSPKVAKLYQNIWYDNDSPMRVILKEQAIALEKSLKIQHSGVNIHVIDAMTYGRPSITHAVEKVQEYGAQKVLVVPMYPQYSATTTAAVYDQVARVMMKRRHLPELRYVKQYCDRPDYLIALAHTIEAFWREQGQPPEKLLFSFHGIPQRCVDLGDPYASQCHFTARECAKQLNLQPQEWVVAFQSRFGRAQWVQPYTTETLIDLAKQGVKRIDVVCPAFSADCLETLEEIAIQNRDVFLDAGGEVFRYIPALNSHTMHIDCLTNLVTQHIQGWI